MKNHIKILPKSQPQWRSYAANDLRFENMMAELIDNSISNLTGKKTKTKSIYITLENYEYQNNTVKVSIEDTGTGINDLIHAFFPGRDDEKNVQLDSQLNEHGFGLKNALATANIENDSWELSTITEETAKDKKFNYVKAPWRFQYEEPKFIFKPKGINEWEGQDFNTGTLIKFDCKWPLFKTVAVGSNRRAFNEIVKVFCEDIGVRYRNALEDNKDLRIQVKYKDCEDDDWNTENIDGIFPKSAIPIKSNKKPKGKFKLNNGKTIVDYSFYYYPKEENFYRYYKHNQRTNGVEIRLNGRLIEYNIFTEIWGLAVNNQYNNFLGIINIIGETPKTTRVKTKVRRDDDILLAVFRSIGDSYFPADNVKKTITWDKENSKSKSEKNKVSEGDKEYDLEEVLKSDAYKFIVNSQRQLFSKVEGISNTQKPEVDLFCENENGKIILIELKKEDIKVLDVYQLLMYHDGYVYDKDISPDETWLIAEKKPKWANSLLEYINTLKDQKNNKYNVQIKTYDDFRHRIRR
tara:strand:- start:1451 stop:3013 length:1563 start_codon:yes stop_codon:yes gene_type:complete